MKTHLSNKTLLQLILSVITVVIFVFLAVASSLPFFGIKVPKATSHQLPDGRWEETFYTASQKRITTGKITKEGYWTGPVTVKWTGGKYGYTEECTMLNGERYLLSTRTYNYSDANGPHKEQTIYAANIDFPNYKAAHRNTADASSFQVLGNSYSWYFSSLVACGFDSAYVEAYLDTVDIMLNSYEFEPAEFNTYYEDVLSALEETPYDSIIVLNSDLFLYQGLQEIKKSELRLAVLDHYRSEGSSTFNIISTTYPGYLQSMNDTGVVNQDFEKFCQDLDDSLASYGPLDREDPYFIDSVDSRLFRALYSIIAIEMPSSSLVSTSLKSAGLAYNKEDVINIYHLMGSNLKPLSLKSSSSEVAAIVAAFMLMQFIEGDIIRFVVREAYFTNKGIISIPIVATVFSGNVSATSVELQGYVIKRWGWSRNLQGNCLGCLL